MKKNLAGIEFSIDLIKASKDHLRILRQIERLGNLYNGAFFERAIYRYERIWIPLMEKYNDTNIVPPIDVQWIWNLHLLSPTNYIKDIQKISKNGQIINNRLKDEREIMFFYNYSKSVWETFSSTPYEYFQDETRQDKLKSKIDYNFEEVSLEQREFLYQVSLPHFDTQRFLEIGIERYKKFLFLRKAYPSEFFVPCNLIQLILESHQLHPVEYAKDCMQILGFVYNEKKLINRLPVAKIPLCVTITRELWRELYQEEFFLAGAMFRGKRMDYSDRVVKVRDLTTPFASYNLVGVYVLNNQTNTRNNEDFKVTIYRNVNRNTEELYNLDVKPMKAYRVLKTEEYPFLDSSSKPQYMTIVVEAEHKFHVNNQYADFRNKKLALNTIASIEAPKLETEIQKHKFDFTDQDTLLQYSLILEWKVSVRYNNEIVLFLKNDQFKKIKKTEATPMLTQINELFINKLDSKSQIFKAKHKLRVPGFDNVYAVEALITNNPTFAALQIHLDNHVVASSKLIGQEQLPPEYLDYDLDLDNRTQRAMLIQHLNRDYAILKAEWLGFQSATSSTVGRSGYLAVEWHSMGDVKIIKKFNFTNPAKLIISNPNDSMVADVDMTEGVIIISFKPNAKHLEAFLASVFSIALLNALVMPKFNKLERTVDNSGALITQNYFNNYVFYDAVAYGHIFPSGDN